MAGDEGDFKGNPPATDSDIRNFDVQLGTGLPQEYVRFLKTANGGCGFYGCNYLDMFPVEKLFEYNQGYASPKYARELFLFGSDGGGEAFAFDRRKANWPVVKVPFIPLDVRKAIDAGPALYGFFDTLKEQPL
jgi:hypothetical protein